MLHTCISLLHSLCSPAPLLALLSLGLFGVAAAPAAAVAAGSDVPPLTPAQADDAASCCGGLDVPPVIWRAGGISVLTLQDRPGSMAVDLFSGPATPEQRQRYFTDGKAPSSVSTFLIRTGDKNILVDSGYGAFGPGKSELQDGLAALGLTLGDIDIVLLTHMHMDHIGGLLQADGKRAFPKARIAVSRPELDYWVGLRKTAPDNVNAAQVEKLLAAYGTDFMPPFALDAPLLPGLTALNAVGHTPGHTAFLLEAEGRQLLIIGDLVHAADLQFPLPDECARYDLDRAGAVAARKKILGMAADKNIPVAGMHLPFPAAGQVTRSGDGFALTLQ